MPETIQFAEWMPDRSDRHNPASEAKGVISVGGQYGPFKSVQDYNGSSAATAATCLGARTFYDSVLVPHIYMGDATKLYHLEARVATDRSKVGGYSLGADEVWQFAQYGDIVVGVAPGEAPQEHDMLNPTSAFANLAASAPQLTSIARVNDFLMGGLNFTVHWCAFNTITDWTPSAATQAGNQALDQEQGEVQAIVGLDYAAIFQERAIRRAIYIGPPIIWDFGQEAVEKRRGCISRNAATVWGRSVFYVADDGFYMFDGQASTPIGAGKVDDYFIRNLNYAYRHKVCCAVDGINKLFVCGFPAGGATNISELLIMSLSDGRWTHDVMDLEFLFDSPVDALTVDTFHTLYTADDLDATNITPDDIDSGAFDDERRLVAGVQTNHRLGFFTGSNRPATIETGEFEPAAGRRALVTEIWPLGDFPQSAVSASLGYRRALPGAAIAYTNPTGMNAAGYCPQRMDARFVRGRLQIAAQAIWRRAEGLNYTARLTGGR